MPKTTDIPSRILKALDGKITATAGLTVAEVAKVLVEKERTVRDHLDSLVDAKKLAREYLYKGKPPVGAYRYFRHLMGMAARQRLSRATA